MIVLNSSMRTHLQQSHHYAFQSATSIITWTSLDRQATSKHYFVANIGQITQFTPLSKQAKLATKCQFTDASDSELETVPWCKVSRKCPLCDFDSTSDQPSNAAIHHPIITIQPPLTTIDDDMTSKIYTMLDSFCNQRRCIISTEWQSEFNNVDRKIIDAYISENRNPGLAIINYESFVYYASRISDLTDFYQHGKLWIPNSVNASSIKKNGYLLNQNVKRGRELECAYVKLVQPLNYVLVFHVTEEIEVVEEPEVDEIDPVTVEDQLAAASEDQRFSDGKDDVIIPKPIVREDPTILTRTGGDITDDFPLYHMSHEDIRDFEPTEYEMHRTDCEIMNAKTNRILAICKLFELNLITSEDAKLKVSHLMN